jgi:hypothetical protein
MGPMNFIKDSFGSNISSNIKVSKYIMHARQVDLTMSKEVSLASGKAASKVGPVVS